VTKSLKEGWELWGNPFATFSTDEMSNFCQAVVRVVEKEPGKLQVAEEPAGFSVGVPEMMSVMSDDGSSQVILTAKSLVGGFFCSCLEIPGDNPDCPIHHPDSLMY
jgi:hypothetical protein